MGNAKIELPSRILDSGTLATIEEDVFGTGRILCLDDIEQSHVELGNPTVVRYEYLARIANAIAHLPPGPLRVLHLGAGALTLPRFIHATRPGSTQWVVELETGLIDFVLEHLPLDGDLDLTAVTADAREALPGLRASNPGGFDVVVVDIFRGADSPRHLTTREFSAELAGALADGGLLAINVGDDPPLTFASEEAAALLAEFDDVALVCERSMLRREDEGNVVLLASNASLPAGLLDALDAAGPHPAASLDRAGLVQFVGDATPRRD